MHRVARTNQSVKLGALSGEGQPDRVDVVFVCVHNAGRSRMAEAFFNDLGKGRYRAESAGTMPADHPHPEVVEAMAEVGLDVDPGPGRLLTEDLAEAATHVVTMGCAVEDACPALTLEVEDWGLDDPKGQSPERVAEIRDEIELRVRNLIGRLDRHDG
jgi:arsenate reductase (thioredoxin)